MSESKKKGGYFKRVGVDTSTHGMKPLLTTYPTPSIEGYYIGNFYPVDKLFSKRARER